MNKLSIEYLATLSRFALAAAIFYFAFQLYQINQNVPAISQSVDQLSRQVAPSLEEARAIREELAEFRKLIPSFSDYHAKPVIEPVFICGQCDLGSLVVVVSCCDVFTARDNN